MNPSDIRVAVFSGNYNYVRDGANQALNRLVGYLLRNGAKVRVYSPVVEDPAFPPTGELVHVKSVPIPGRKEYRATLGLSQHARRDLANFAPNVVHIASPDIASHRAVTWARARNIPAVASIHTRFDTYLAYYHLEFLEPTLRAGLRRLYRRCDALLAPAESMAAVLRAQRMNRNIFIWTRGVDREQFNPERRDMAWRRSIGIGDDELAVVFLGRLVVEKGLDDFAAALDTLKDRGVPHHALVIGEGPARAWFEQRMPSGVFLGQQEGVDLARALASADVFLNPSMTEAFGNVTLESMASGVPVVAAAATGTTNIIQNGKTGLLCDPGDTDAYADALERYAHSPTLRARHGKAGIAYASTQDWDEINAAVIKAYRWVIERRARLTRMASR
jgi:glycosyltransferase involved in cell wall biosynthesis